MKQVEERALLSLGQSEAAIYEKAAQLLRSYAGPHRVVVDVGCGRGNLRPYLVNSGWGLYTGVDVIRYEGFPAEAQFHQVDLDTGQVDLPNASADAVIALETIEHVENPRAFMRELYRLVKPGGVVCVSTPNQLSLLSKFTLLLKNRYNAFQDSDYPAHITALLEVDLQRMGSEIGLVQQQIAYSEQGRVVKTHRNYPRWISRSFPQGFSDHVIFTGVRPSSV